MFYFTTVLCLLVMGCFGCDISTRKICSAKCSAIPIFQIITSKSWENESAWMMEAVIGASCYARGQTLDGLDRLKSKSIKTTTFAKLLLSISSQLIACCPFLHRLFNEYVTPDIATS